MSGSEKAWGGRFSGATARLMERFNASIGFDRRLLEVDVAGSKVYARALERAGLLTTPECASILEGLDQVLREFSAPGHEWDPGLEDVHMAVEARLTGILGPLGASCTPAAAATTRSVSTSASTCAPPPPPSAGASAGCRRSWWPPRKSTARRCCRGTRTCSRPSRSCSPTTPCPCSGPWSGTWAARGRPGPQRPHALGSGALAGSAFALDREFMARELGFSGVTPNSLDAVSDRDFLLEALAALSILMMHLSRYCEDLVLFSSAEFGFVELDDAWATGSSMMPQKKNPDSLELVRGKTGRVYGDLVTLLTAMKGLGLTYGKDLQEDKEPVFDAFDTASDCLEVFASAWETMKVNAGRMARAVDAGTLATELADFLVEAGVPFREAHRAVGAVAREASDRGCGLTDLTLADLQSHHPAFDEKALGRLGLEASLDRRNLDGGTGPAAVKRQLLQAREILAEAGPEG